MEGGGVQEGQDVQDNQLYRVTKRNVQQGTNSIAHAMSHGLGSMAQ